MQAFSRRWTLNPLLLTKYTIAVNIEPPNPVHNVLATCKRMASRPNTTAGRVILGTMQIKRLQPLVNWVKDYDRCGMESGPKLWMAKVMNTAMERKESEYNNYSKVDIDIINPGQCQTDFCWDNWQIAFVNMLNATMGAAKVSVDYIVCPKKDDTDDLFLDDDEMRRFQMLLTGENFKRDNKLVYQQMLKSACIKSDAGLGSSHSIVLRTVEKLFLPWLATMMAQGNCISKLKGLRNRLPACTLRMRKYFCLRRILQRSRKTSMYWKRTRTKT